MITQATIQPPVQEYKSRPRPANLPYWIMCFLHHHKDRSVPRSEIIEEALIRHYSRDQVFDALKSIDKDIMIVNVGCWWESSERVEYWRWYDMTFDEVKAKQDDNLWFESL